MPGKDSSDAVVSVTMGQVAASVIKLLRSIWI